MIAALSANEGKRRTPQLSRGSCWLVGCQRTEEAFIKSEVMTVGGCSTRGQARSLGDRRCRGCHNHSITKIAFLGVPLRNVAPSDK